MPKKINLFPKYWKHGEQKFTLLCFANLHVKVQLQHNATKKEIEQAHHNSYEKYIAGNKNETTAMN